ncbi:MAG: lipopolysaccharide assembly protein LapA domain-containing protein [Pseudomonadota bacterium]
MKRKLVLGLVIIPLGVALIALAVVNREPVGLILDPFGGTHGYMVQAPMFLFLLLAFALGLLIGGFASWLNQGKWRRTARSEAREARDWRQQADRLERQLESVHAAQQRPQLPAQ